jgi:PIN domain nuclease of toxin-antitoxin system
LRLLLDTHAYAWWVADDRRLPERTREVLVAAEAELLVSAVVPWELATKFRIGKWPGADLILADLAAALVEDRLTPLPITLDHARRAGLLASIHKDPFDRVLAAQAEIEGVPIVTADPAFRAMDVETLW